MNRIVWLAFFSVLSLHVQAQWINGTNIYNSNSGNVGIGLTNPGFKLDINVTGVNAGMQLQNSATRWVRFLSPSMSSGAYSGITRVNDAGFIFGRNGFVGPDYGFVIAPHSNSNLGLRLTNDGKLGLNVGSPTHTIEAVEYFTPGEPSTFIGQVHDFGANTGRYGIGLSFVHTDGTQPGMKAQINTWFANTKRTPISFRNDGKIQMTGKVEMDSHVGVSGNLGVGTYAPVNELDVMSYFQTGGSTDFFVGQNHDFSASTGRYGIGLSFLNTDATQPGMKAYLNTWFANTKRTPMTFRNDGKIEITGKVEMDSHVGIGGNVGIGTYSPVSELDVLTGFATGSSTDLFVGQDHNFSANTGRYGVGLSFVHTTSEVSGRAAYLHTWFANTKRNAITFRHDGEIVLDGNVGIGSADPDHKLDVNGTIHAKEVLVDLNVPGPDYVFEPDYELTSLEEIAEYIKQNKHLPEVPSAKEMETNGVELLKMNMLLLKKVEELTLHLIDERRANEEMKGEIRKIKKELQSLRTKKLKQ
jgi:hypothetical protein